LDLSLPVVFARIKNANASMLKVCPALSFSPWAKAAKWPADGPPPVVEAEIMRNLVALRLEAARLNALTDQIQFPGSRGKSRRKEAAKARQAVADTAERVAALTMLIATMSYASNVSRGESETLLEVAVSADAVARLASAANVRAAALATILEMSAGQAAGEEEPATTVPARNELEAGQRPGSAVRMMAELVWLTATIASEVATSASEMLRAAVSKAKRVAECCRLISRQRATLAQLELGVLVVVESTVAAEAQRADLVSVLARCPGRGRAA
jgi:hypothetical protein